MKCIGIVAVAENGVIGREGRLPWHIPADLKEFKRLTRGNVVVMGRKTFESIGRPLPERRNIVLTRDPNWYSEGVEVFANWKELKQKLESELSLEQKCFVIGGAQVYALAWNDLQEIYLTLVHDEVVGDAKLEQLKTLFRDFKEVSRRKESQDLPEKREFSFIHLTRN